MKKALSLIFTVLLLSMTTFGQDDAKSANESPEALVGSWQIDLTPSPGAEPYFQTIVVKKVSDDKLIGSFYGSNIKQAVLNTEWPKLYFAFTTSDKNNAYYHSGYLENGKLFGMTYCPDRDFAAPWTGTKNE